MKIEMIQPFFTRVVGTPRFVTGVGRSPTITMEKKKNVVLAAVVVTQLDFDDIGFWGNVLTTLVAAAGIWSMLML